MIDVLLPLRKFKHSVVLPSLGWIFDLKGGRFLTDGCTLDIPKDQTDLAFRSQFLLRTYEARELRMVRKFVRPTDSVLELGACLGVISCVTNKRLGPQSRHLVVEANPRCLAPLTQNRDRNHCSFQIEHCAVGAPAMTQFALDDGNITGGRLNQSSGTTVRPPVKSLRQLQSERGPFNVLVCDIEGAELALFEESADLFKSLRLVIVELHDFFIGNDGVARCQEVMKRAGLELVAAERGVEAWQRGSDA